VDGEAECGGDWFSVVVIEGTLVLGTLGLGVLADCLLALLSSRSVSFLRSILVFLDEAVCAAPSSGRKMLSKRLSRASST